MPRRGENIFHRKDGRWEARYVKEITNDNKKIYGSVYAKTYKEVKLKRDRICVALANGNLVVSKDTLGFYIRQWLKFRKVRFKISTYVKYYSVVDNYLLPYFDKIPLKDLSSRHLDAFTNSLLTKGKNGNPLSSKTVKDILLILKNVFKFIQTEYNINININIVYPHNPKKESRILTKAEFINLNNVLLQDIDPCKFGVLIAMATGIRIGELCALKWSNINLDEDYLYIEKTMQRIKNLEGNGPKTIIIEQSPKSATSIRKIPIPKNLIPLFKKFKQNDDCYLLTGKPDKFIEPRALEKKFKRYIKLAEIESANFHMLRHTFATLCIEEGFEIKCLSEILGHSGSQITLDRYVHSSFKSKKDWIDKFASINISSH